MLQSLLNGLVQGALYAIIALGYTLVYGILELINFAHGDVFMIGGMISASIALEGFGMSTDVSPAFGTLVAAILVSLVVASLACGLLNVTIERLAYKPLRNAPRLAPLITAIGVSFILENVAIIWKGTRPCHCRRTTSRPATAARCSRSGTSSTRSTGSSSSS